jgi:hypothetical protein
MALHGKIFYFFLFFHSPYSCWCQQSGWFLVWFCVLQSPEHVAVAGRYFFFEKERCLGQNMFLFKCFAQERKAGETSNSNSTNVAPDVNKIASSNIPEEEAGTKWGYDLYPERKGDKFEPSWAGYLLLGQGQANLDKLKCEQNVVSCAKNSKNSNS